MYNFYNFYRPPFLEKTSFPSEEISSMNFKCSIWYDSKISDVITSWFLNDRYSQRQFSKLNIHTN